MIECETCGKRFQTARGLSWHTERAHTEPSEARAPSPHQKANDAPEGPRGAVKLAGPSAQSEQAHEPLTCGDTIKIPWDDGRTATAVCGSPEGHDGRHIALAEGDPSAVTWADGDAPLWLVPLEPMSEEPVADVFEPVADDRAGKDELADGDKGLLPPKEGEESSRPPFRLKLLPIFRFGKRRTDS